MQIDLMPWLIGWGIVTTAVVALALYRATLTLHEVSGVHLSGDPHIPEVQAATARRLQMVDLYGKVLTVVSTVVILAIAGIYGYQVYMKGYEVIGH